MKKILYLFISILTISSFLSCEKKITTEDNSKITYYVTFELDGDDVVAIPINSSYQEPGYKAMEGETDVSSTVEISSDVDETALGVYTISYSAENIDGYSASVDRTVVVYDPSAPDTDISGSYTADVVRTESDGSEPRAATGLSADITYITQGIFYIEGLLGNNYASPNGSYGYGSNYTMSGYVALNSDNTLTLLDSYVPGWGDGLEDFYDAEYDPATGGLSWTSVYANADIFKVTLY